MKLERRLYIDRTERPIISADVTLQLSSIGRAVFVIQSDKDPSLGAGLVSFQAGYTMGVWYHYFLGHIKRSEKRDSGSWVIDCRELSEALLLPCPVSLRDCSMMDVAADMSRTLGIRFDVPSQAYSTKRIPRFASTTDALTALQNIGRAFVVDGLVWQMMPDGSIWLGDHADSKHATQGNIEIADNFFKKQQSSGLSTLAALPSLRPGMIVNDKVLDRVRLTGMETHIQWSS